MEPKPASERHVRLRGGDSETKLLAETIHNAVVAIEALATLWEQTAKNIGTDGQKATSDAILDAFMRFGDERRRIINILNSAVCDAEGAKWWREVVDNLETVIVEMNAPNATMTSLATEMARAGRLRRVADQLNYARRDLAYGHLRLDATEGMPQSLRDESRTGERDGPKPPDEFRYKGSVAILTAKPYRLVEYLYRLPNMTADAVDAAEHVWGDDQKVERALPSLRTQINRAFLAAKPSPISAEINIRDRFVTLKLSDG